MSLLTKLRPRSVHHGVTTVGNAVVVHAPDGMSPDARSLASALPADPDNDLVVADMPTTVESTFWEYVATSLPRSRRGLRLVLTNGSRELGGPAGHWLSARLGRTVLAPAGILFRDLNGGLFVDAGPGTGWLRFQPGSEPAREAKRFPRPSWESLLVNERFGTGKSTAEPMPSGLWLRPEGDRGRLDAGRNRITHSIPCRPDVLTIALGGRDLPELPLDDVVSLWEALPPADHPKVRFVHFGPVATPSGTPLGQALADLLDEEITCYTGMPVGRSDVHLLREDGSHGWNAFVQQLTYSPHGTVPKPAAYRAPLSGLRELAPGTYEYAPDVVLEVVSAGLWVRPAEAPANADEPRATPVDPATMLLLHEDTPRMRTVAQEVHGKLDYAARLASRLVATSPPDVATVEEFDWLTESVPTTSLPVDLSTPLSEEGMTQTRARVRESWPKEFGPKADPVREIVAAHPKLAAGAPEDALALHLYLTDQTMNKALRDGRKGPYVDLARCAVTALRALPQHRGGTVATLTPTAAQWDFYRHNTIVTEPAFHSMLTAPPAPGEGEADLLVWSMTARRTAPLDATVADRVVFPPGTRFKVLELTDGERPMLLLRELSPAEIFADGTVDETRHSLDQLATTSLRRFAEMWKRPATNENPLPEAVFRFPGVE
ncbi:hypothetical protein [Actinophytocola oryzae]|uniref:Uncharacterized protein n=1 Tax=Actinophytocola oryzae TaxID=502181 RepID=A0A4R7V2U4_9PSEU|nr:hypothetical protein [Actinophytocola oryzae]TDV42155.1 hypothetical protein CLV71_11825 [Actinophytocola oryzae]